MVEFRISPDVIRFPAAICNQIAVEVRIVNNVPCLVDGTFKCQHQVQLLVHGCLHQVDAGGCHRSVELVAMFHLPGNGDIGVRVVPCHEGLLGNRLERVPGKILVVPDQLVQGIGG